MRLSYKFWRSNRARHDHGPKHNLPVASTVQVTSVGYEEIHATWFLTYSLSKHEEDLRNITKQITYSQSTQGSRAYLALYPNLIELAAFSNNGQFGNDSNPVILRNG